ncbi:MAG TPA: NIPSNAP family protein [Verrucomicrobiae bacterium]|nr:NIPSNAP family protein [Verrucomicrobiae bacterium]
MNRLLIVLLGLLCVMSVSAAEAKDSKVYEMRIYYAPEGKLETLHKRFREHTVKLFEKHGIENVGYWVPVGENKENKLAYIIAHPSREAAKANWAKFFADPDWQKAAKESEKDGKIVAKVESYFMTLTDYSPVPKPDVGSGERVFEFRTYTTPAGGLDAINARFRDHTVKLFEKHGMKNVAYFNRMKDMKEADTTLFYILAHKSEEAGKASFDAFRKDPDWVAARKASEEKAGGSLTVKDGVKSELYKATDYSPIR